MVIREILEAFDKEIAAAKAQQVRIEGYKLRVLECCRSETAEESPAVAGRIGECEKKTTARRRRAA